MLTFIEILEGSNAGSRYKVAEGVTLGRGGADIVVKDPKISALHAKVTLSDAGRWTLLDLDSSNGVYISGRRVKKVSLIPGVIFEIGRTKFKVVLVEEEKAEEFSRIVTWCNMLAESFADAQLDLPLKVPALKGFNPALKLTFIQGIQADEEIILGYGPRYAGSDSLDIELFDEDAPKDAFELHPGPGSASLKVSTPGLVSLNNKSVNAETLQDGDLISFGTSVIRISYV
ncbi:MAG: FHA domain-containing protein [Bdellovibrio sp.]|nr:FHA domain-containing protein [Bdellovibrio sp.]